MSQNCQEVGVSRGKIGWIGEGGGGEGQRTQEGQCAAGFPCCAREMTGVRWEVSDGRWGTLGDEPGEPGDTTPWIFPLGGRDLLKVETALIFSWKTTK